MKSWAKQKGFTIVELLIVIVVIAILAAISIVAYNGIQQRAESTKTTQALATYAKALQSYKAINDVYPQVPGFTCITGASTKCSNLSDTAAPCFGVGQYNGSATLDTALATVITSLPQPSSVYGQCGGKDYGGIFYDNSRLIWFLQGNQTCTAPSGMINVNSSFNTGATRCLAYLP